MRNVGVFLPLVLLLLVLTAASPSFAKQENSATSGSSVDNRERPFTYYPFRLSDLIGREVLDHQGESLGNIEDILIGQDGRVNFVVLARYNAGHVLVPVPWRVFVRSGFRKSVTGALVADLSKGKLDKAPSFTVEDWPRLSSTKWQKNVYSYYGIRKPRTEPSMEVMGYDHPQYRTPNAGGEEYYEPPSSH